jgi:hypothetical protein
MDKKGTTCSLECKSSIEFIESQVTGLHKSLASIRNNLNDRQTIQLSMLAHINNLRDSLTSIRSMMHDFGKMNVRHNHDGMGHKTMVRHLRQHNVNPTTLWSHAFACVVGLVGYPRLSFVLGQHTPIYITINRAIGDGVNMYDPKAIQMWLYDMMKSSTFIITHRVLVIVSEIMCTLFYLNYD